MREVEKIAARIRASLPNLKSGTLRFWGQWFGRPYDNVHQVTACEAKADVLRIYFSDGETLLVWSPDGAILDQSVFKIRSADRVRWEWFAYGRGKTQENRYFMDFQKSGSTIKASTDVDWYFPDLRPTILAPAVEIL